MEQDDELLTHRFGDPEYFANSFLGCEMDDINLIEKLDRKNYEITRQRYLAFLSRSMLIWVPSNTKYDLNVEMSRIFKRNPKETIGFMRIKPGGFRGERRAPQGVEYLFFVLVGTVQTTHQKKARSLPRGKHLTVPGGDTFSLRNNSTDEIAILLFRSQPKPKKKKQTAQQPTTSLVKL